MRPRAETQGHPCFRAVFTCSSGFHAVNGHPRFGSMRRTPRPRRALRIRFAHPVGPGLCVWGKARDVCPVRPLHPVQRLHPV